MIALPIGRPPRGKAAFLEAGFRAADRMSKKQGGQYVEWRARGEV
jgi:hypothetical protein